MKRKSIILALILSVLCSQPVLAATWMKNDTGWWWQEDDGSYPVSSWKLINGYWYYFHSNGYMAENEWIGDYYVGSDGAMLVNTVTPDGYRVGADGAWIRETGNSSGAVTREKAYEAVDKYVRDHSNAVIGQTAWTEILWWLLSNGERVFLRIFASILIRANVLRRNLI